MIGQHRRLTKQEEEFIRLVVEEGCTYVDAYRIAYPPRNGERSAEAERVAGKRVAHRPLVQRRMAELREELLANDPVEMRRRANAVLGRILAKKQDPRYRRTALDVLRYLDEQERSQARTDWATYREMVAQIADLDGQLYGKRDRRRSSSLPPEPKGASVEPTIEVLRTNL